MLNKPSLLAAFLLSFALCATTLVATATDLAAQTAPVGQQPVEQQQEIEPPFKFGTFDFTLSAGFSSWLYLHVEPGAEFGLIPLGNDLTLGVGGMVNVGYCLLCPLITGLVSGVSLSSWYVNPMGRANLHLGPLAKILELPQLDAYVGAVAGPGLYRLSVEFEEIQASGSTTVIALLLGPVVGARFSLDDRNRWLIFGEARFLLEMVFGESVVRVQDQEYRESGATGRGGMDVVFGLGYRI